MNKRSLFFNKVRNLLARELIFYPRSVKEIINPIANQAFLFGIILYPLILAFYIYRITILGWRNLIIFQVAIYLILLICYKYRGSLSISFRALIFLIILAVSNIMGIFTWGLMGAGMLSAILVCVYTSVIFGNRIGFTVLILYSALIIAIAVCFISGTVQYEFDVKIYSVSPYGWGVAIFSTIIITSIINVTFIRVHSQAMNLVQEMEIKTDELQRSKSELENEIAEHKKTEVNFQSSQSRYRILFESANDAIFLMKDDRFIDCNKKTLEMFRCTREEIIGSTPYLLSPPLQNDGTDSRTSALMKIQAAVSGVPQFFEWRHARRDWSVFDTEVSLNSVEFGNEYFILAIVRDISEKKRVQREKEELQNQINQAVKMQAMGTLAGGIAHDFNNILTVMIGNADLLLREEGAVRPENRKDLELIRESGLQARELIKQILTFSRKESSLKQTIDLVSLLKDSIRMLRPLIPTSIRVGLSAHDGSAFISGNPTQIQQVIFNICSNSAHAIGSSTGEINIGLENILYEPLPAETDPNRIKGPFCRITITDDGEGIAPEIRNRIFDPFFTTKKIGEGTGLGLSVVHGIIVEHRGFVEVSCSGDRGTSFIIYLPLLEKQQGIMSQKQKTPGIAIGSERVLLVDDDENVLQTLKKIIASLGYTVTARSSSEEALNLFASSPSDFDMVITDRTMSDITGEMLIRKITGINPYMPVILISGFHDPAVINTLRDIRHLKIVNKPIIFEDLAASIRGLLDSVTTGRA